MIEELKLSEGALVNEETYVKSKILWQGFHERDHVFNIVLVLVLDRLLHILIQVERQPVLVVDLVEKVELLIQLVVF